MARLAVRNLAVVEAAEARFGPGLNVITGETGAGKSVLMGALHLVLGERADRSAIRTGADEAAVSAVYELADTAAVDAILRESEIPPCEEGTLIIRRAILANGNGRIRVNDAPATAALLRRLAPLLTDIHGPTDNLSLLDAGFQLRLLSAYAGAERETARYAERWEALQTLKARLREDEGEPGERRAEAERLAEAIEDIRAVNPTEDDGEPLLERHKAAANAGEILSIGNALTERLSDGEGALTEQLMEVHRALRALGGLLPEAEAWGEELTAAATAEAREITLNAEREAKKRLQSAKDELKDAIAAYGRQIKAEAEAYGEGILASGAALGDASIKAAGLKKAEDIVAEAYLKKHGCR